MWVFLNLISPYITPFWERKNTKYWGQEERWMFEQNLSDQKTALCAYCVLRTMCIHKDSNINVFDGLQILQRYVLELKFPRKLFPMTLKPLA